MPRKFTYDHPRPMASADTCLFSTQGGILKVLLVKRGKEPFKGKWALPGGFLEMEEDVPVAAARELMEETGIEGVPLSFLGLYAKPGRDPRGRMISSVFTAQVPFDSVSPEAGDDAADAAWHPAHKPPPLAFDHSKILKDGISRLRAETVMSDAAFRFLGPRFTEGELRAVFEAVLKKKIPTQAFLDEMDRTAVLEPAPGGLVKMHKKRFGKLSQDMCLFRF